MGAYAGNNIANKLEFNQIIERLLLKSCHKDKFKYEPSKTLLNCSHKLITFKTGNAGHWGHNEKNTKGHCSSI